MEGIHLPLTTRSFAGLSRRDRSFCSVGKLANISLNTRNRSIESVSGVVFEQRANFHNAAKFKAPDRTK